MTPLKILFKYPCRGREKLFFESLDSLVENIADKNNYHISLTLDKDDQILNQIHVLDKILSYENTSIAWGTSQSKIHAVNRSIPDYPFDIIVNWSNDMFATFYGFDEIFRQNIWEAFGEEMDGLAHFPEPDAKAALNVLYVATKKYYDRFGYIYHPDYFSLFADNESMEVAQALGRYRYFDIYGLFTHRNPAYSQHNADKDEMFLAQQEIGWTLDRETYNFRKQNNFFL